MGVIGIVASRLVDRFYRPAVLLTTANGVARGSARSINGINVFEAIRGCEHLLIEFGGHDHAAGLTLPIENVHAFASQFEQNVATQVRPEHLDPVLEIEAELELSTIDSRFWAVLKQFEPFGPDNDCPVFLTSNLLVADGPRPVGKDGAHVKFVVRDALSSGTNRDVIGFRMGTYTEILEQSRKTGRPIQLVYSVDENTWNGRRALQLQAIDLRLQEKDSS
jgi:single-stranded-DNA-specific exonuclease